MDGPVDCRVSTQVQPNINKMRKEQWGETMHKNSHLQYSLAQKKDHISKTYEWGIQQGH